jgi:3',5'-cyclic AMP phosphodiesterase CpdA
MGKRIVGFTNWWRSRRRLHDMGALGLIVDDIRRHKPDHIACTGDMCHIGLPAELPAAVAFLDALGPRDRVSFVPGNHDAYVPASLAPMHSAFAPWATGDDGADGYPWLKVRGQVALIGLTSAVPTPLLMATGRLGPDQIDKAEILLRYAAQRGLRRVILIHHPPHRGGAKKTRDLTDAARLEAMLAEVGADLVLHGHNHRMSLAWMAAPQPIPVLGVACSSMGKPRHGERAGWQLIRIPGTGPITVERRTLTADGALQDQARLVLDAPG